MDTEPLMDLRGKIDALDAKLEETHVLVRKIHRSLLITAWVTVALVVLPAIGLLFAIPAFLELYPIDQGSTPYDLQSL